MKRYRDKVKYWMTFNEINNQKNYKYPLFGYTCSGVIFEQEENPEECMYQVVHHELVASALVVKKDMRSIQIFKLDVCLHAFQFIRIPAIQKT